jgi:MFS family permease
VNGSNFTVATKAIIKEFHVSQTQAGELVCFNVFLLGLGNVIWVPLMRVVGKRPVYLISMILLSMMNFWSSRASSYGELLASRILSGFASAAADATVPAVVSDMVPPQDRGHYLMFFHLALTSGLFIGPLINAYLVQEENWRWMCCFLAIAAGAVFAVAIFTVRETTYLKRNALASKRRPLQWMSLTIGYNPDASFLGTVSDVVCNVAYPQLLWAAFAIGISVGW